VKEKDYIGHMLLIYLWKNLLEKMGYFFDEHGLIVCPCLEQQQVAKIIHNMAFVGTIETTLKLTLRPFRFVAQGLRDSSSWKVVVKILG
jgi:hypothetical protein